MANTDQPPTENAEDPPETPLYAAFELEDGGLVLYDESNHRAWVQSDHPVSLAARA